MNVELQSLVRSLVFSDIAEPADHMESFHWSMDHRQIEGGAFEGELLVAQLAGMQFARVAYNRGIRSWGDSPTGMITIAVPLSVPQSVIWHGHSLSMNHALLQKSSRGVDFLRRGAFQIALVSIDVGSLLSAADQTHQPDAESAVLGDAVMVQPDETAINQFRHYFQNLFALIESYPQQALQPALQTFIRQEAITLMLNLLSPDNNIPEHCPYNRYQLMKQAEEMMLENLARSWTVHSLCTELHISERTLRYGFHEYFGMPPMAYLKIQRLNAVQRQLKTSTADQTTVTDVAIEWGFWHMGQFAKDYKKMFGESPSKTLRCPF